MCVHVYVLPEVLSNSVMICKVQANMLAAVNPAIAKSWSHYLLHKYITVYKIIMHRIQYLFQYFNYVHIAMYYIAIIYSAALYLCDWDWKTDHACVNKNYDATVRHRAIMMAGPGWKISRLIFLEF